MKNILGIVSFIIFTLLGQCVRADDVGSLKRNHDFQKVEINYRAGDLCSFQYSSIYFCDDRHIAEIKKAIATMRPNFNGHYIIASILERRRYYERSLVVIDADTGIVYPFPFDSYSGFLNSKGDARNYGRVSYRLDGNDVCVSGSIVAYRETDSGKLCWKFENGKFVGHRTPYTDE
ncbi:MAG: hypothetical protein KGQ57_17310 [Burkholderiales bacterium]|nr:hypothetical protein [Burkholderiales bacterium]